MTSKFRTGGALAAVAAALAFTAVPASAQDWHRNHDNNSSQQSSHNDRKSNDNQDRHEPHAWGHQNPGDTPQRTNTPAATQSHGQWSGRHDDNHVQATTRVQASPGATANNPWRAWNGSNHGATTDRNRGYVDQGRNTTYVDPNRNTSYRDQRNNDGHDWHSTYNNRNDSRTYRNTRGNYQQWDRNWRNNNRYDWQRYRSYNRNAYHLNSYYAPYRGYSYRQLGIGFYLDPLFYGQDYWIGDPGYYRLPDVYGPYRWVRYYNDALLVDVYSGQVVDVLYNFFW